MDAKIGGNIERIEPQIVSDEMNSLNAQPEQPIAADEDENNGIWMSVTAAVLGVIVMVALWVIPDVLLTPAGLNAADKAVAANQLRISLILLLGLAGFLAAVFMFWRVSGSLQKSVGVFEESNITSQFGLAIEHLGTYKLEVQLGGIFALERIANQSENDHWMIMEVLTAYLRENAQWQDNPPSVNGNNEGYIESLKTAKITADIQAIMTVIGRRNWVETEITNGKFLNLRKTNLGHLDLRGSDLRRANLRGVNLSGANLMDANLAGAFLGEATLVGTNLVRANLQGAHLAGANLQDANMREVNVEEANLSNTNMKGAFLNDTNLESAHFSTPGIDEEDHENIPVIT